MLFLRPIIIKQMKRHLVILIILGATLLLSGGESYAWVSPGNLTKSHSDLEGLVNCFKCHSLTKKISDKACANCHEKLIKRINANKGYHAGVKGDCAECHTDHKGVDFDISGLDKDEFDHDMTGYRLMDKHKIECERCHKLEKTYLDLVPECLGCHTDVHQKSLSEDCIKCHSFKSWKDLEINHDKDAAYKLTGKHIDVKCDLCHPRYTVAGESGDTGKVFQMLKFKPLEYGKCDDCHVDIHKGKLKEKVCTGCHITKGWEEPVLDHNDTRVTDYKLIGKHEKAACRLCHPEEKETYMNQGSEVEIFALRLKPLKYGKCTECHYDVHESQFKKQECDDCHSLKDGWSKYTFRHESKKYKGFKLEGKHKDVVCEKCHERSNVRYSEFDKKKRVLVGKLKPVKSRVCNDCHYDIHEGQFKKQNCDACHLLKNEWKDFAFRHDSKKYKGYKLEGKHKEVECKNCHQRSEVRYTEFKKEKKASVGKYTPIKYGKCSDCHYDVHKGQFKEQKCISCHLPEKEWRDTAFDHKSDKGSSYKLEGKHVEVVCEKCHERIEIRYSEFGKLKKSQLGSFKPIKSDTCKDCHKDEHKGKYTEIGQVDGIACDNCHAVDKAWKEYVYTHKPESKYTKYNPDGQIKESNCEACHVCEAEAFCLTCCFEKMGFPGR